MAPILVARFQVYRITGTGQLVIDLQANILDDLGTRIVAPFLPASEFNRTIGRLNPRVDIGGELYIAAIHLMGAVPSSQLNGPELDLTERGDEITAALDFAFQGF